MTSRRITLVAMGTYNPWHQRGRDGINAGPFRGMIWYFKDNQPGKVTDTFVLNQLRQGPVSVGSPEHARDYCAAAVSELAAIPFLVQRRPMALVPIPSSKTTPSSLDKRWPAYELAKRLAARGLGTVRICLAQKRETEESKGRIGRMQELIDNLHVFAPPPDAEAVVLVDDVVTSGEHLAAADHVLGRGEPSGAIAVGITQGPSDTPLDAFAPRFMTVVYYQDPLYGAWDVTLT